MRSGDCFYLIAMRKGLLAVGFWLLATCLAFLSQLKPFTVHRLPPDTSHDEQSIHARFTVTRRAVSGEMSRPDSQELGASS
jgi:hypothetical protein